MATRKATTSDKKPAKKAGAKKKTASAKKKAPAKKAVPAKKPAKKKPVYSVRIHREQVVFVTVQADSPEAAVERAEEKWYADADDSWFDFVQTGDWEVDCDGEETDEEQPDLPDDEAADEAEETGEEESAEDDASPASDLPPVVEGIVASMVAIPGKDFKMGKFPVTQAQWEAVMGENPSEFKGAENPVERVSWKDCQKFLKKLNAQPAVQASGLVFRLPEEDEWEFACRAGSEGDYCKLADGTEITEETLGEVAWFDENSDETTHPVGQKKPNAFGLYDMHGNVWEWTNTVDRWFRVICGGCWRHSAGSCKSSNRDGGSPGNTGFDLGFRLCADRRAESNDGPPSAE